MFIGVDGIGGEVKCSPFMAWSGNVWALDDLSFEAQPSPSEEEENHDDDDEVEAHDGGRSADECLNILGVAVVEVAV